MISLKKSSNLTESKKLITPLTYELINVLSWHKSDTLYYELSPYYLKTDQELFLKITGKVLRFLNMFMILKFTHIIHLKINLNIYGGNMSVIMVKNYILIKQLIK